MKSKNMFIKIICFQLKQTLDFDSVDEFLIPDKSYHKQMQTCIEKIEQYSPDIAVFPEMSFSADYSEKLLELSKNMLIVFGSSYINGTNITIVYQNNKTYNISKLCASGAEPMARKQANYISHSTIRQKMQDHCFNVKGKKIYVLNCMEYYQAAYYIARDKTLNKNLFGFISPCVNSNQKVFEQETKAIHNHNDKIYSFVVNCIATYGGKEYAKGETYIYGTLLKHEREWLKMSFPSAYIADHGAGIAKLSVSKPSFVFGEYFAGDLSRFGRSDFYVTTPKNMIIDDLKIL